VQVEALTAPQAVVDATAPAMLTLPPAPTFAVLTIRLVDADELTPGQSANLTFLVVNPGVIDANGTLTLRDTLPAGLTFVDIATVGWTCFTEDSQLVTCTSADAVPGGSQTQVQLVVNAADDASGLVTNLAGVNSPSLDPSAAEPTTVDTLVFVEGDPAPAPVLSSGRVTLRNMW
jgi:uncharacterized repeat protein (TIGR01451 family)